MKAKLKYFTESEFNCPCCGANNMDQMFLYQLDIARDRAGIPFVIKSGFRCPNHNTAVGGVYDSAHMKGKGADIEAAISFIRYKVIDALLGVHFNRIGIGTTFIHVDNDIAKPENVIWLY
jgi:zinc D-Ala-D-Ala carboxypeptidase